MSWSSLPNMGPRFRFYYDFEFQPAHPDSWVAVQSRALADDELFQVGDWLRTCCQGRWDTITHYTPALRQLVYFERASDAVLFKLAWN